MPTPADDTARNLDRLQHLRRHRRRARGDVNLRLGRVRLERLARRRSERARIEGRRKPKRYCFLGSYCRLNNPLIAFQRVRADLSGPARATRTGTFDRFKMSRVKSPMM